MADIGYNLHYSLSDKYVAITDVVLDTHVRTALNDINENGALYSCDRVVFRRTHVYLHETVDGAMKRNGHMSYYMSGELCSVSVKDDKYVFILKIFNHEVPLCRPTWKNSVGLCFKEARYHRDPPLRTSHLKELHENNTSRSTSVLPAWHMLSSYHTLTSTKKFFAYSLYYQAYIIMQEMCVDFGIKWLRDEPYRNGVIAKFIPGLVSKHHFSNFPRIVSLPGNAGSTGYSGVNKNHYRWFGTHFSFPEHEDFKKTVKTGRAPDSVAFETEIASVHNTITDAQSYEMYRLTDKLSSKTSHERVYRLLLDASPYEWTKLISTFYNKINVLVQKINALVTNKYNCKVTYQYNHDTKNKVSFWSISYFCDEFDNMFCGRIVIQNPFELEKKYFNVKAHTSDMELTELIQSAIDFCEIDNTVYTIHKYVMQLHVADILNAPDSV
jgi:hypothetical protein